MTFSSLEIDIDFFRDLDSSDIIQSKTDTELKALYKDSAKNILKSDIAFFFELVEETTDTAIDSYINKYTADFQRCLAYLQLLHFYRSELYTNSDLFAYRIEQYQKMYNNEKAKWSRFYINANNKQSGIIEIVR